jgi:aspartyl-tRNA(Asn)/glutamyl-tRNA(Gln) amidotransferase subunit A
MSDLAFTPATELAAAVRRRQLSPVEIAEALLERIESLNPKLNAYVHHDPEAVRARARSLEAAVSRGDALGPLHGVPYSIKDMTAVAGIPMTWGLVPLKDQVPERSAALVERLEAAGGLFLATTG